MVTLSTRRSTGPRGGMESRYKERDHVIEVNHSYQACTLLVQSTVPITLLSYRPRYLIGQRAVLCTTPNMYAGGRDTLFAHIVA